MAWANELTSPRLTEWVAATQGKRQGGVTVAKFHPITNPTPKGSRSPRNFLQAKQAKFPYGTGSSEVASQISLEGTARRACNAGI
jgi:hypothetical protein